MNLSLYALYSKSASHLNKNIFKKISMCVAYSLGKVPDVKLNRYMIVSMSRMINKNNHFRMSQTVNKLDI